jgi:hypothetical protein
MVKNAASIARKVVGFHQAVLPKQQSRHRGDPRHRDRPQREHPHQHSRHTSIPTCIAREIHSAPAMPNRCGTLCRPEWTSNA